MENLRKIIIGESRRRLLFGILVLDMREDRFPMKNEA